jgi:hypothetical protein
VVQEHGVDGLAHGLVAAERERDIAHSAAHVREREALLQFAARFDEIDGVTVVLLDPGRDGENIGVEDDVLGREAELFCQNLIGPLANGDLALRGVGLALFVEGHHDHGRAVTPHGLRMFDERRFAFLERDRIHHALALRAL